MKRTLTTASIALLLVSCASSSSGVGTPGTSRSAGTRAESLTLDLLADSFERVRGAVVTLHVTGHVGGLESEGEAVMAKGIGSGVLVTAEGYVLTAAHVVQSADEVVAEFSDGVRIPASVVSSNPTADVALVKLLEPVPAGLVPAPLGKSDEMTIGSRVFVVGAPLGISHTVTVGHLSARRKQPSVFGMQLPVEHFQTDAAINVGNSGGPMFDAEGNVIGIVSHIISLTGANEGLGFAVTMKTVRELLLDKPPLWSGMEQIPVGGQLAAALNVTGGRTGLLVQRVATDSPAERMGLRPGFIPATIGGFPLLLGGDLIISINGRSFNELRNLEGARELVQGLGAEDHLEILVLREGKVTSLRKRVGEVLAQVAPDAPDVTGAAGATGN